MFEFVRAAELATRSWSNVQLSDAGDADSAVLSQLYSWTMSRSVCDDVLLVVATRPTCRVLCVQLADGVAHVCDMAVINVSPELYTHQLLLECMHTQQLL